MAGRIVKVATDAELFATVFDSGDFGLSLESNTIRIGEAGKTGGWALATGSGATTFTDLGQTPATLGTAGQILSVNAGGTALEFVDPSAGSGATDMKGLTDTPAEDATAYAMLRRNAAGDAWEYVLFRLHEAIDVVDTAGSATDGQVLSRNFSTQKWEPRTLLGLPALGTAGKFLRVNGSGTAAIYTDASLGELSDVTLTSPAEDDILQRDAGGVWRNVALPGSLTDTYVVSGSYNSSTATLQLTNNAGTPGSFTVDLTTDFGELGNIDDTDRDVGSIYYFDGTNMKAIPAPSVNQALKWSGSAWVYEDVLIVDANFEPDGVTAVADMYAAGTILVSDGDSYNPLPRGNANEVLTTSGGNLIWKGLPVHQFTDRTDAVAADWTGATFPCLLVINLDQLKSVSGLSAVKQAWVLLAAPTSPATPANEIPIGPRMFDENGAWAKDALPFPEATHAAANFLAHSANCVMTASGVSKTDATEFQEWIPVQRVLGTFIVPGSEIVADTRSTAMFRMNTSGLCTKWGFQVVDGDATGNTAGTIDAKLEYVGKGANISTIADFTGELTLSGANSGIFEEGLQKFLTGSLTSNGLLREGDRIYASFGTNVNTTYDIQVTLFGYDLEASTVRVVGA